MLTGLFLKVLTSGVLEKLLDTYKNSDNNKTVVLAKEIEAEIARRNAVKDVIAVEQGSWWTSMQRPLILAPFILHLWAVVLDSVFNFTWDVAVLPGMFHELEFAVVLSYFITRPIEKGVRGFLNK